MLNWIEFTEKLWYNTINQTGVYYALKGVASMARSSFQKLKLLYIRDYFYHSSDEEHPITVQMIRDMLLSHGIEAERKSIYDDIELLGSVYEMDIIKPQKGYYYLGSREFELPEVKLLIDTVTSSKFLTEKKAATLIKKISGLSSDYQAERFSSQSFVQARIKNMNESIYLVVDEIFSAISGNCQIRFKYYHYDEKKQRHYSNNGGYYTVSPFAMIIDDDYYYLAAYDEQLGSMRHFRADRIEKIEHVDAPRVGYEAYEAANYKQSDSRMFSMFSGVCADVTLLCDNSLAHVIIDRFGKETVFVDRGDGSFSFTACVSLSRQFFGWVFGLGGKVKIISPAAVAREYADCLKAELAGYEE